MIPHTLLHPISGLIIWLSLYGARHMDRRVLCFIIDFVVTWRPGVDNMADYFPCSVSSTRIGQAR